MSYSEFASMSTGEFFFVAICMLAITVICYCMIPVTLRFTLAKKKSLTKGKIIAITVANSVLIFLIMQILTYNGSGVSLYPAIIWGIVNYLILISGNKKYHIQNTETPTSDHTVTSLSAGSSSYSCNPPTENAFNKTTTENAIHESVDEVGQGIAETNSATSPPPRVKKRLPKSTIACLCIIIALTIGGVISSFAAYNVAYDDGYGDGYDDAELESKEDVYEIYLVALLDHAVFVTEYGEKYHRFGCHYIIDSDKFWIYNVENAKVQGYDACSYCFGKDAETFLAEDLS